MMYFFNRKITSLVHLMFITFTVLAISSEARVGDRKSTANSRYGKGISVKPTIPGTSALRYSLKKWKITCEFYKDICVRTTYKSPYGNISERELEAIFSAEGSSKYWSPLSNKSKQYHRIPTKQKAWSSPNGHIAHLSKKDTLHINSKDLMRYVEKHKKESNAIRNKNTPEF